MLRTNAIALCICVLLLEACTPPETVTSSGPGSELLKSETATAYLLRHYTETRLDTVSWPPEELTRTIDVSFDVTGSMYERSVVHQDRLLNLALYDLRLLEEFLTGDLNPQPGDIVRVRLFGANYRGSGAEARDERVWQLPSANLVLQVHVTTRPPKRVIINVREVRRPDSSAQSSVVDSVIQWLRNRIESGSRREYLRSPLLEHIRRVATQYEGGSETSPVRLVFVTDGLVELENLKLTPERFVEDTTLARAVMTRAQELNLLPTALDTLRFSVTVIGLFDGGSAAFGRAQRRFFSELFRSQSVRIFPY